MKLTYESTVRNDLQDTFAFIMNFERRPEWINFMDRCFLTHTTDHWIGSRFKEKLVFLGIPLFVEYEITHYEENRRLCSQCNSGPFYQTVDVTLTDNGDGTVNSRMDLIFELGPFRLVPKGLLKRQIDNFFEEFIENFKRIMNEEGDNKRRNT